MSAAGRAAVDAEPAAGKTAAGVATAACLGDAIAAAVAAAGRAAFTSARGATAAFLDAGTAAAAAVNAAAVAAFLFSTQASCVRALAASLLPSMLTRIGFMQEMFNALVAPARFKSQSGPGACSNTLLV